MNKKNIVILVVLAALAAAYFEYQSFFGAPQRTKEQERVVVNLTTSESELIPKLKEQGYIKNEWAFNFVLRNKGWEGKIKPGGYLLSKGMNAWETADALVNHLYQKWIVIPEGLRAAEIFEKLQKELNWDDSEKEGFFNNAQEGYLFPDTYLFDLNSKGADAAKRMESHFNEKTGDFFKQAAEKNIRNDTLVILASLIQREAGNEKEMPLIAGVIWNRLLKNMPLQIDATIQYALGRSGNWWPVVKREDYTLDSVYNTYLHEGKPPKPICNPGLAAIDSVVNSKDSDYLYYLHDSEGIIHLAKTYEEHLRNIENYLK